MQYKRRIYPLDGIGWSMVLGFVLDLVLAVRAFNKGQPGLAIVLLSFGLIALGAAILRAFQLQDFSR